MAERYIGVAIDEPYDKELDLDWLERVVQQALDAGGMNETVEVSLLVVGDEAIHELNRQYRGIDAPTDVLSFSLRETRAPEPGEAAADLPAFPAIPDGVLRLGEVILSYPRAVAQAAEARHPVRQEVALLVVHGVLHLLGHDHERPEDERLMQELERQALERVKEQGTGNRE